MFDEAESFTGASEPRWPLHPQPMRFEHLDTYVRRLADVYGIGLGTFCRCGLGITLEDWLRCHDDPPLPVLERLSSGSGLPLRRLRNMTPRRSHARMMIALRDFVRDHPEHLPVAASSARQQTPV
ncbi:MAG: TniQ family protein [Thermomicrobiales bacterium]